MGTRKYNEGTENEFVIEYSDTGLRFRDDENDLRSDEFASHTMTAFELPNINQAFQPRMTDTYSGSADSSNPITYDEKQGYTVSDTGGEGTYFTNAVSVYSTSTDRGDTHTITSVTDIQRLLWKPNVSVGTLYGKETYTIDNHDDESKMYLLDKDGNNLNQKVAIYPLWLAPIDNTKAVFTPNTGTTTSWFIHVPYRGGDSGFYKCQYEYSGAYVHTNGVVYYPTMGTHTLRGTSGSPNNIAELSADGNYVIWFEFQFNSGGVRTSDYCTLKLAIHTETEMLYWLATFGYKFEYNGTIYKPIVEGGYVTGYTDDMSKTSEWDNWHNISDHTVPTTPPKHKTDTDGIDDMTLGFTGYENGFVNYYICTAGNISNLVGEMSSQTDFPNLIGNIVSLKSYACSLNGMYSGDIVPIKVGQYQATATGIKIATTTYSKQIASFNIKGAHGTIGKPHFLDYAPYTRLEVYIPFCGTVPLPPECMYNTVTVHIVTDVTSGSCTGVVKCNGNIVAQKSGIIGTTIPLSINDSASQNNAFNQGMMNTANAGGKVIASGAVGSVNAGGILGALGSAFNTVQTMNDNYTRVIGTQGDKSAYAMPKNCYLKRYRTIDLSDAEYTATIGRPVCKRRSLASGDGFTVCDNPQVHGAMTLAEKNEIEQFMRNGIIL